MSTLLNGGDDLGKSDTCTVGHTYLHTPMGYFFVTFTNICIRCIWCIDSMPPHFMLQTGTKSEFQNGYNSVILKSKFMKNK